MGGIWGKKKGATVVFVWMRLWPWGGGERGHTHWEKKGEDHGPSFGVITGQTNYINYEGLFHCFPLEGSSFSGSHSIQGGVDRRGSLSNIFMEKKEGVSHLGENIFSKL